MLVDTNFEKLKEVKKELEKYHTKILIFDLDVSDEKNVYRIVDEASYISGQNIQIDGCRKKQ